MSLMTADPIRQALACRALLGWLAGRHPADMERMLTDLSDLRLAPDVCDVAEETLQLAREQEARDVS